jgi:8-oxo-dGTP pyrophosphatase MutT (NUDIX family)
MTEARVGIVDVLVLRRAGAAWEVLVLERAEGTRCTGAWEIVHGRIEDGERPEEAALREVREETALAVARLYSITVNPFYLAGTVQLAVVFAAVVDTAAPAPVLSEEHARAEWLPIERALDRLAWPRERQALRDAAHLLRTGDAGPVEDVLRVR